MGQILIDLYTEKIKPPANFPLLKLRSNNLTARYIVTPEDEFLMVIFISVVKLLAHRLCLELTPNPNPIQERDRHTRLSKRTHCPTHSTHTVCLS